MPTAFIKNLSKKTKKSIEKLEKYWKEALKQAKKKGLTGDNKYAYATEIVNRRASVKEGYEFDNKEIDRILELAGQKPINK